MPSSPRNPVCEVEFTVDDQFDPLVAFVTRISPVLRSPPQDAGVIDLRRCEYIGPFAVGTIGARIKVCQLMKKQLTVKTPQAPPQLINYCKYSGLNHWANLGPPPDANHPDSETVPLSQFRDVLWGTAHEVIQLIKGHIELTYDDEDALQLCFQEVGQNISDHAESMIGGVFTARYIANRQRIRVALVDRGIGILATLRPRFPEILDSRTAIKSVLEGGFSARTFRRNRGHGIRHLRDTVERLGGEVSIFSGDAAVHVADGQQRAAQSPDMYFPGTGIFFVLPVSGHASPDWHAS